MSSPFQKSFSAKSPLAKHGEIRKALRQAKKESGQDFSYERVSELQSQFDNAKAAHKEDQNNIPSTGEEQQSTINMNSPVKEVKNKMSMTKKMTKLQKVAEEVSEIEPSKIVKDPNNRQPLDNSAGKKESPELKPPVHQNYPSKKKTESVVQMKSPLNSYGDGGRGEVYLSDQPAFQEMQGKIQAAAGQVMSNWTDEDQEEKLTKRISRRGKREKKREKRTSLDNQERFYVKTKKLEEKKTGVTNKITANMRAYEADKIAFGNTKEGKAMLKQKYPQGPPRRNS